jgi:hypothetical protein
MGYVLAACYQGRAGDVGYGVAVSGAGNQVTIAEDTTQAADAYIATIHSTRGIGQASIAWWGSSAPHHLEFLLHLGGLEFFSLRWAEQIVRVSINSMNQAVIQSSQRGDGAEAAIAPDSPHWMAVTMPTHEAPVYRLAAPAAFLTAAPKAWGIAWIDYYR